MQIRGTNPALDVGLAYGSAMPASAKPSESECEIIDLYGEFRTPLLRYVVSLGLPVQDGEEVVQEVFLALFRHLQLGKSRHNLRGWIFRVAHNLGLKRQIANRKAPAPYAEEDDFLSHSDASPNPEEQAAASERAHRLQAVLRALPELDRCCLNLRAEGLRYREIAAALGVSLGTVSLALTRALARMARVHQA